MIVHTSALVAVVRDEEDANRYAFALAAAGTSVMSAATYVEASIVIDSAGDAVARRRFDDLLRLAGVSIEPLTEKQAGIARSAYRDYGKGSGHPARLNLGDCFSYALARDRAEPLLYKGADFVHTDIEPALRDS